MKKNTKNQGTQEAQRNDENTVILSGAVSNVRNSDKYVAFRIKSEDGNGHSVTMSALTFSKVDDIPEEGDIVCIKGRLCWNIWDDKNGVKHYDIQIVYDDIDTV